MAEPRVTAVSSVELGVTDVEAAAKFYRDVWGLEEVAAGRGMRYLRGTGPEHHIVVLHRRPRAELVCVNLAVAGEAEVDALHAKLGKRGIALLGKPARLDRPGGGYGFAFKDPEGRNFAVAAGVARHDDVTDVADRPRKISHCVLNATDMDGSIAFFVEALGFTISDRTGYLTFLRCNSDHHSIALGPAKAPTLHHIAFEMPDLESVMRGAGRLRDSGYPIEWGVGRHGPGNNVFSYFVGPEGFVIEYTAEVEQVDDSYPTGGPGDWGFPEGRTDRWGVTDPPSERMHEAQGRIAFAETVALPA